VPRKKPGRQKSWRTFRRYIEIDNYMRRLTDANIPVEAAVAQTGEKFGLSDKQIYEALAKVGEAEQVHWGKLIEKGEE
jgi:hypothetical protein